MIHKAAAVSLLLAFYGGEALNVDDLGQFRLTPSVNNDRLRRLQAIYNTNKKGNNEKRLVKEEPNVGFYSSVVAPDWHNQHRQLQEPLCVLDPSGELFCYAETLPVQGFLTIFSGCKDGGTIYDCKDCVIVQEEDIGNLDLTDLGCRSCSVCSDALPVSFDCSNIDPQEPCASQDCDGNCTNEVETQEQAALCTERNDGSLTCAMEKNPQPGLVTIFADCTANDGVVDVYQCGDCIVAMSVTVGDFNEKTPVCNSCGICPGGGVSSDCSNLFPTEPCSVKDCDGNCVSVPPGGVLSPPPTMVTTPVASPTTAPETTTPVASPTTAPQTTQVPTDTTPSPTSGAFFKTRGVVLAVSIAMLSIFSFH